MEASTLSIVGASVGIIAAVYALLFPWISKLSKQVDKVDNRLQNVTITIDRMDTALRLLVPGYKDLRGEQTKRDLTQE